MINFLERATKLEEPKDLPSALHQLKVLKAIIGHLEAKLHDALGVPATGVTRTATRELLNRAYAAQRALGELGHTAQLAGVAIQGAGHPMPEALGFLSRAAVDADTALVEYLFPVAEDAVPDLPDPVPTLAQIEAVKGVCLGTDGEFGEHNVYADDRLAEELLMAVLKAGRSHERE